MQAQTKLSAMCSLLTGSSIYLVMKMLNIIIINDNVLDYYEKVGQLMFWGLRSVDGTLP